MNDSSQPVLTHAMRLIFEYAGDQVRLVSQQPVEMVLSGFDPTQTGHPGYFVDARNARGRALARVPTSDAFSTSMEVFPETHDDPISRIDIARPHGAFTVVVPAPEKTDHFSVIHIGQGEPARLPSASRGMKSEEGDTQVTEIARFPLRSKAEERSLP